MSRLKESEGVWQKVGNCRVTVFGRKELCRALQPVLPPSESNGLARFVRYIRQLWLNLLPPSPRSAEGCAGSAALLLCKMWPNYCGA